MYHVLSTEQGPSSSDTVLSGRSVVVEEELKDHLSASSNNADDEDGANERKCTERDGQSEDVEKRTVDGKFVEEIQKKRVFYQMTQVCGKQK